MADNNEEEYLDALLKSMINGDEGDEGKTASSLPIDEEFGSSEDDDMMMLSKMLLDDNDISYDDDEEEDDTPPVQIPEMEHSDMESFFSLDDLLGSATNNTSGDVVVSKEETSTDTEDAVNETTEEIFEVADDAPAEEPEITPIISDDSNPFGFEFEDEEVAFTDLESLMHVELANMGESTGGESEVVSEEPETNIEEDFFSDFDGISSMFSNESTAINEDELRRSMQSNEEKAAQDAALEKELADILALDEGMSINDIPDEQSDSMLTEEEKMKVQGIEISSESDEPKGKKAKRAKKAKKEKEPKPKKEKKAKADKKAKKEGQADIEEKPEKPAKKEKPAKPAKEKSKFSFKEFFAKFNDDDDEDDKKSLQADNNQKLIDDLYKGKDSLDDADLDDEEGGKKGKKDKKKKTPKPKKEKPPKDPALQEPINIGKFGKFIIFLLIIVFLFGGFFGVRFINYQLTINSSKKYFEMGNYDLAYDKLSGIDIMKKDSKHYNGVRTVMIVYQGYTSYNNYVEIDREAEALDALINAVGRKQQVESDAVLYDVTKEVNIAYEQIMTILAFYGIDERIALDLYKMTDYEAYYEILHSYEGVAK